jgi:PIN domain nuclease of toxin-antitoxin system
VSHAEFRIKSMLGKLVLPDGFAELVGVQGFAHLAFNHRHAEEIGRFSDLVRHDPFDRMLLAQAAFERVAFLTVDRRLLDLGLDSVHDASV